MFAKKAIDQPSKFSILTKKWWVLVCYAVVTFLYFWPFLHRPAWNLIDDGLSLQTAQTLVQHPNLPTWSQMLIERTSGRLRPFYFLFFVPIYLLAGTQPFWYWFAQAVVIFVTLCLLWQVIALQTEDGVVARALPLLFLFHPAVSENLARLGTAEPHQFLAMLIFIAWLLRQLNKPQPKLPAERLQEWGGIAVSLGLYGVALLFKESSVILLPMSWMLIGSTLLIQRKWRWSWVFLAVATALLTAIFLLAIPHQTGYTQAYHASLTQMVQTALQLRLEQADIFWPLTVLIILTILRVMTEWIVLHRRLFVQLIQSITWPTICLIEILLSLGLLLPWQYAKLDRYFYVILGWVFVYGGVELWQSWQTWQQLRSSKLRVLLIGLWVMLSVMSLSVLFHGWGWRWDKTLERSLAAQQRLFGEYQAAHPLIRFLETSLQPNSQLLVWHEDYERVLHIGTFASRFSQQPVKVWTGIEELVTAQPDRFELSNQAGFSQALSTFETACEKACYVVYRPGSLTASQEKLLLEQGWELLTLDEVSNTPLTWQVWSLLEPHRH